MIVLLSFLLLLFTACSEVTSPHIESSELVLSPQTSLARYTSPIDASKLEFFWPKEDLRQEISTADYFFISKTLNDLGHRLHHPGARQMGKGLHRRFYEDKNLSSQFTHKENLFIYAAVASEKEAILEETSRLMDKFKKDEKSLRVLADRVYKKISWSKAKTLHGMINKAQDYIQSYTKHVMASDVDDNIKSQYKEAIVDDIEPMFKDLEKPAKRINRKNSSLQVLISLEEFLKKADSGTYAEYKKDIAYGKRLANQIMAMKSDKDVLAVILELWKQLSPKERKKYFATENQRFYNYMKEKTDKGKLDCVVKACNLVDSIAKHLAILPELRDVEKYRGFFENAVKTYILDEVASALPDVPHMVWQGLKAEISEGIDDGVKQVKGIRKDASDFAIEESRRWSHDSLFEGAKTLPALEQASVIWAPRSNRTYKVITTKKKVTSPSALGGALLATASRLNSWNNNSNKEPGFLGYTMNQVNKLLAIGGFPQWNDKNATSLARPLFAGVKNQGLTFDLASYASDEKYFAMPNQTTVTTGFKFKMDHKLGELSVSEQATLLWGLSDTLHYFRDWKSNKFDEKTSSVTLEDVLPEFGDDSKVFPKEVFHEIALANTTMILKNLILDPSILVLFDTEGEAHSGDKNLDHLDLPTPTAALFDIKDSQRVKTVNSADLSRFIIALVRFYEATDDIQKSQSSTLVEAFSTNSELAETIIDVRDKSKSLVLALSNFLSSRMIAPETSLVRATTDAQGVPSDQTIYLQDQALAIVALSQASQITAKIYQRTARSIFLASKEHLWNEKTHFYFNSSAKQQNEYNPAAALWMIKAMDHLNDLSSDDELLGSIYSYLDHIAASPR